MKSVARHSLPVFLFWLLFFVAIRPLFALWQPALWALSLTEILQSMAHGLYMDFSMAGYFSILPIFILAFRPWLKDSWLFGFLNYYHFFLVPLVALLACTDLEIYHIWGHRLDSAILPYLAFPKEALASAMASPARVPVLVTFTESDMRGAVEACGDAAAMPSVGKREGKAGSAQAKVKVVRERPKPNWYTGGPAFTPV